jgi:hypothetical protein
MRIDPKGRHRLRGGRTRMTLLALALATGPVACAAGGPGPTGAPPVTPRGVPGFDTRSYPGDATMSRWLEASPYRWVGFYLPAPCYTGTTWQGKRDDLARIGWGAAVLFVGEQDWARSTPERAGAAADSTAPRCTRDNLTPERGRADATAASEAASAEGFSPGTWIYLDVERVETVSHELERYVEAWARGLLDDGRFLPGLYAHEANAEALVGVMADALRTAGHPGGPRLWVAKPRGFSLRRAPSESGFPGAAIWQGRLDARETWGGITLRIDANVAASGSPSS